MFASRRNDGDERGGGIEVLADKILKMESQISNSKDILQIRARVKDLEMAIVVVYMDVMNQERNEIIRKE